MLQVSSYSIFVYLQTKPRHGDLDNINIKGSMYKGCDEHYSPAGHKVVADDIKPQLEEIMG